MQNTIVTTYRMSGWALIVERWKVAKVIWEKPHRIFSLWGWDHHLIHAENRPYINSQHD